MLPRSWGGESFVPMAAASLATMSHYSHFSHRGCFIINTQAKSTPPFANETYSPAALSHSLLTAHKPRASCLPSKLTSTPCPTENQQKDAAMASNLNTLPMEILLRIAEISTWGVSPSSKIAHPANYARNHASLARTCRWLYEALNGELYKRNLKNDPVTASCLVWPVDVGNLDTVKRAVAHGATLNFQVEVDKKTTYCPPWRLVDFNSVPRWHPFDCPCSFSLLHLAVGRQYVKIVQNLLEQKVDVHAPSRNFCCKGSRYGGAPIFPLHLCHFRDHQHGTETR